MIQHNNEIQQLKKQAELKRAEDAKLANPFTWINSYEINSKNIPSLMDLKLEQPFKLIQYSTPEKKTDLQKYHQLSRFDPRNKIYYMKRAASTSCSRNVTIPLEAATYTNTWYNRKANSDVTDHDILELQLQSLIQTYRSGCFFQFKFIFFFRSQDIIIQFFFVIILFIFDLLVYLEIVCFILKFFCLNFKFKGGRCRGLSRPPSRKLNTL